MPGLRTNCAPMSELPGDCTDDDFLDGRLRLRQLRQGHRAGHDAILLAASVAARPGDRIVDLGAGVGAAGLAVAARVGGCDLTLVEIDPALAGLARHNAAANHITARVLELDAAAPANVFAAAGLSADSADVVLMNPPFNDPVRHRASPDRHRRAAHVASPMLLADWAHAARRVLKSRGALTMIWRADGLREALAAVTSGFGSVAILPVHGRADAAAIRVIVRAVKGGRGPLQVLPAFMLNDAGGGQTAIARDVLSGRDLLPLAKPSTAA